MIKYIVSVVAAFFVAMSAGLVYQNHQISKLNESIGHYQHAVEDYKGAIANYKFVIENHKDQVVGVDKVIKETKKVYVKQQVIRDKIRDIPDTSDSKPFANPEILLSAQLFREYQQNSHVHDQEEPVK